MRARHLDGSIPSGVGSERDPVWYGATADDVARFGLGVAVPDTVFLDPDGQIVARVSGEIRRREVKERLDWILGDRTGPAPDALMRHLGNY